jgi:hypothetical protein
MHFIHGLEGFELATFWVCAVVVFFATGYLVDMLLVRQGWGPYVDSVLAFVGGYGGLFVQYKYLQHLESYEPYLTIGTVLTGIIVVVVGATILRARFM